jgi:hypothetical protein
MKFNFRYKKRPVLNGTTFGGEGGIRTHGSLATSPHFECGALVHYATSPELNRLCF